MKPTNAEKAFFVFAAIVDLGIIGMIIQFNDSPGGEAAIFAFPFILIAVILSPIFIMRVARRLWSSFTFSDLFSLVVFSTPLILTLLFLGQGLFI